AGLVWRPVGRRQRALRRPAVLRLKPLQTRAHTVAGRVIKWFRLTARRNYAMLGTLVRCSVAAVASIALLVAFVSTPEGFTKAKKPRRTRESEKSRISKKRLRSESPPTL